MRILTFTTLFPNCNSPNSAIFIKNRMAAVNKLLDVDVRVVAPIPWFPKDIPGDGRWQRLARVPRLEQLDGLSVIHPRYLVTPKLGMTFYGFSMYLGCKKTVTQLHKDWPFDLIDAHYVYPDGLAAILLGKMLKVPVVLSARGTDMNLYPKFRLIRPLIRKTLKEADQLISVCQSLSDIMVANGADKNMITVVPNGIDPNNFRRIGMLDAKRISLNEHGKIILSVGSLIERKGHYLLIQAVKKLKTQGKLDFITYIVGQGPDYHKLQKQIDDGMLAKDVKLVGEVNNAELVDWYCAADLFFLGSSREGWPNVVSESLACGTPVVATKVNGIPEIICSNDYGIIVERNPDSFVEGIRQALQKKWDRNAIAEYGRQRTWAVVAREVRSVFKKSVAGGNTKAELG